MLTKIISATINGCDAAMVNVEVSVQNGLPATVIVGLADAAIKESKERVRACLRNSAYLKFPLGRISINLAPADIFKSGTHFDLAIALGILHSSGQIKLETNGKMFLGELAFNGSLNPVRGVLAMVLAAKDSGIKDVYLPIENLPEAKNVADLRLFGCENLSDVLNFLSGRKTEQKLVHSKNIGSAEAEYPDFSEIRGQKFAKRGLEISAAGGHNLLMIGSPGCGKTMLAEAFQGIVPKLSRAQKIETMKLYGINGSQLPSDPPFRNPHHTISLQAFVGGGQVVRPGEISLAHNGILFLDEFPEFARNILESLRQPLEKSFIKVARAQQSYIFPADFILIAAQNPCKCGNYFNPEQCSCSVAEAIHYRKKISGPILDRIDLQIRMDKLCEQQSSNPGNECSVDIVARVEKARGMQRHRNSAGRLNSKLRNKEIVLMLDSKCRAFLDSAQMKFQFSLRTYYRAAKVARTIADLSESAKILPEHLAEALRFRLQDKVI